MAYAIPTAALTCSPASPVAGQDFDLVCTISGAGTVDDNTVLKTLFPHKVSGPDCVFGNPVQSPIMAGSNLPSGYGSEIIAHDGTIVYKVRCRALKAGTLVLCAPGEGYRTTNYGTSNHKPFLIVPSNISITIQ